MASTDANPIPKKNIAYRVTFPIYDTSGALVTGAAGLDSEVSKDAGSFADCTNEATEIAQGLYYLDLTATEMNADTVAVIVKTSTSGAIPPVIVLYPADAADIAVNVVDWKGATAPDMTGDAYARLGAPAGASVSADVAAVKSDTAAILVDTGTSGVIVASIANNAVTAAALASDAGTEIATAVWANGTRTLSAGTNIVLAKGTGITGFNDLDAAGIRSAVGLASANLDTQIATLATPGDVPTASDNASAVWGATTRALTGTQSFNLTGNITGNLSGSVGSVTGSVGSVAGDIGGNVTGTIGGLSAAAAAEFFTLDSTKSYSDAVAGSIVKEIADNAGGSSLTVADIVDGVWDEAISDHETAGSMGAALAAAGSSGDPWATVLPGSYTTGQAGYIVGHNIDAAVSSRATQTSVNALPAASDNAAAVWGATTRTLSAGTNIVLAKGTGVTGFNDLDAAGIRSSIGLASANLDTQIAALPTASGNATAVWGAGTRTLTAGTNIVLAKGSGITGFNDLDAAGIRGAVGLTSANLDTQLGALPTAAELETALAGADDATLAAIAELPTASENAAAVWGADSRTLTGTQAFNLTGNITGNLSGSVGALSATERNAIADALLNRDMASGTDSGSSSVRTVRQALRSLRNKVSIAAGVATFFKEDDATVSHTATLTADADALPIIGVDPAGP